MQSALFAFIKCSTFDMGIASALLNGEENWRFGKSDVVITRCLSLHHNDVLFIAWLHCALVEGLSTTPVGSCLGAGVAGFLSGFIRASRTRCENEKGMNECEIKETKHTGGVKCATGSGCFVERLQQE